MKTFISLILVFVFLLLPIRVANAQELGIGVAQYLVITEDVEDGDIVAIEGNNFVKSRRFYDPGVVGIVVENPAMSFNMAPQPGENEWPVITSGEVYVKASTKNGNINVGDILTTSDIPGVAARSSRPGFAIGIAKESFISDDPEEIRKIRVGLHLHYTYSTTSDSVGGLQESIANILNLNKVATYENPSTVLQYSISGLILLLAIIFGFFTFSRAAAKGIEAAGRNPLAAKTIGLSVILNVSITVVIILAAVALSYFIITL